MKKWISGLLALILTLAACAGCAEKPDEPSGLVNIYQEITGVEPGETLLEAGGRQFPAEMYYYWVAYNCSNLEYNINMTNAYTGAYGELFDAEQKLVWDKEFMDGLTLAQYARNQAEDMMKAYAALENAAGEYGIALTEEDKAAMAEDLASAQEQAGGQEKFQESLALMGISQESFDRISATGYLYDHMVELVEEEGSALYLEPEGYNQLAAYADHILLATKDLSTGEDLSEEEAAAKREKAEDLLDQLQGAEDLEALFTQLADEHSEDTGRASNPDGYVFGKGEMVQEFEDAANALEPGQVSGIVETTYGYHIILRKDLLKKMDESPDVKTKLANQRVTSLLDQRKADMTVELSSLLDEFDVGTFYASYTALVEARSAANNPDAAPDAGDGGDSAGNAGGSDSEGGNE